MPSPLQLRTLRPEDERSFRAAAEEFASEDQPWGFAFHYDAEEPWEDYLAKVNSWPRGENLPATFVPNTFYVGVVDGEIVGRLSLRHELTDFLVRIGGNIGYGVRPSQRRKGYATAMLRASLDECRKLGIERAIITCDIDNIGSRKVIEACGGIFENTTEEPSLTVQKHRFRIDID